MLLSLYTLRRGKGKRGGSGGYCSPQRRKKVPLAVDCLLLFTIQDRADSQRVENAEIAVDARPLFVHNF